MRGWSGLRLWPFFQFREAPVPPVPYRILISLGGAQRWFLLAPAAALQYPSHLGRVVGHAKLLLNNLGHPPPRPDFPAEPAGRGPRASNSGSWPRCWSLSWDGPPGGLRWRKAGMPPRRALLTHWLTAPPVTPRAVAASCCFQPCWTNSQARSRRASFQSLGAASFAKFMRWIVSHAQLSDL